MYCYRSTLGNSGGHLTFAHARGDLVVVLSTSGNLVVFAHCEENSDMAMVGQFDCIFRGGGAQQQHQSSRATFLTDSVITAWVPGKGMSVYDIRVDKSTAVATSSKVCHLPLEGEPLQVFGPGPLPFKRPYSSEEESDQRVICMWHGKDKEISLMVSATPIGTE